VNDQGADQRSRTPQNGNDPIIESTLLNVKTVPAGRRRRQGPCAPWEWRTQISRLQL